MGIFNFSEIAGRYEKDSLVQRSAAETLLNLLAIGKEDDILDLGCGTGHLTKKLRELTDGYVVGIDQAEGMIKEAVNGRGEHNIEFKAGSAESLDYYNRFDVIFCNSAFQWFKEPDKVVANCYAALKKGGRIAIQAPATQSYCPNFIQAVSKLESNAKTNNIFAHFKSPWLFLDSADEYCALFEQAGFLVPFATIDRVTTGHSPDEVLKIFESGAAAGYLNPEYYDLPFDPDYIDNFHQLIKEAFHEQANSDGLVDLTFNRIYLLAIKD